MFGLGIFGLFRARPWPLRTTCRASWHCSALPLAGPVQAPAVPLRHRMLGLDILKTTMTVSNANSFATLRHHQLQSTLAAGHAKVPIAWLQCRRLCHWVLQWEVMVFTSQFNWWEAVGKDLMVKQPWSLNVTPAILPKPQQPMTRSIQKTSSQLPANNIKSTKKNQLVQETCGWRNFSCSH